MKVTLDDAQALRLRRLAVRAHATEDELAGCLLAYAIDEADSDTDPRTIAELLDSIPGASKRAQLGLRQARSGLGGPLEDL
ncbi:MAG TPA: hypothetical protein VJ375_03125 [Gaiellaceae bacterium]|nr:hypothetical protein [Gaiellaceae bacterium]